MAKRGRVSIDALMVQAHALEPNLPRPDAPYDVTDDEAEVWRTVVASCPLIISSQPTITSSRSFCRHVVEARKTAQLIKA